MGFNKQVPGPTPKRCQMELFTVHFLHLAGLSTTPGPLKGTGPIKIQLALSLLRKESSEFRCCIALLAILWDMGNVHPRVQRNIPMSIK